jgi:hypothetical protein
VALSNHSRTCIFLELAYRIIDTILQYPHLGSRDIDFFFVRLNKELLAFCFMLSLFVGNFLILHQPQSVIVMFRLIMGYFILQNKS